MILGLAGYAQVGKDTLCKQLENYERAAFADVLKERVTQMLLIMGIEANLWGALDKESWRDMLVYWGKKMRSFDNDYWVKQLYLRIAPLENKSICITDVRYPSEVAWIKKHGGLVIGLTRPGFGPANDEERESIKQIRIQYPDLPWLVNDGTARELEIAAREIIKAFYTGRCKGTSYVV
jgi:hypothetical protein